MRQRTRARIVVVGGGVIGLAAAWALRRDGQDVVVLERFAVGHDRGSSHGASRVFRLVYEEPEWVALAQEALELWRELEAESGRELLRTTGSMDTGRDAGSVRTALEASGADYELLGSDEVARRFGIDLGGAQALFQPQGGVLWAAVTLKAFWAGGALRENVEVLRLHPGEDGVVLETSAGSLRADVVVVVAGAWTEQLLATAGIEIETVVTRETVAYFELPNAEHVPPLIDWNVETGRHGYALAAGPGLLKVGLHRSGRSADPDEPGDPDWAVVEEMAEWATRRYPQVSARPVEAETCLYTSIEDDRFELFRRGPVVVCSACSGHGFKFAPAIGRRVAELAAP